ncbi:glutathione S-transferase family protein [Simiduia agarivorans]|uniref:Glutathione S-transferase n=1 Tax=Simiduia agarivorans (strain DSM 21679 / JCM 13881 / BCRC 17597 / SA1) TaxID=1117647 RepID=K4KNI4_SIMAS|nr:glutathione S-transferase family protein [Simiduia agarivorans]AFV00607.1 glutathione S-transferase [Simiduia agarivorans SA1 = DSM 21679]
MAELTLVIGNKNYSSWSLRAWLYMKINDIHFDEIRLPLDTPQFQREIYQYSPSGRVPALLHGDVRVWDSFAIIAYVYRTFPDSANWPKDKVLEGMAISAVMEMHAGFMELRNHYPMNCRKTPFKAPLRGKVESELSRLETLWGDMLAASGGPWLCGDLGIVDAYFAPVCMRIHTYQLPVSERLREYVERVLALPAMQEWIAAARAETDVVDADEWKDE